MKSKPHVLDKIDLLESRICAFS